MPHNIDERKIIKNRLYFLKLLLFLATIDVLEYFSNLIVHPALLLTKADIKLHITVWFNLCITGKLILKSWTNIPSLTKNIQPGNGVAGARTKVRIKVRIVKVAHGLNIIIAKPPAFVVLQLFHMKL